MKEPTTAWTKAYLPKEIRDKEKFLLWVKVKRGFYIVARY